MAGVNVLQRRKRPTDSQIAGMAFTIGPSPSPLSLLARALVLQYDLYDQEARDYANRMVARSFAELVTVDRHLLQFQFTGQVELECPDCGGTMQLDGDVCGLRYRCIVLGCKASHGAYPDGSPLGTPADEKTRRARVEAHKALDGLWTNSEQRLDAYAWLAKQLGIPLEQCHIARFDRARCQRVVELVRLTDQAFIPRRRG